MKLAGCVCAGSGAVNEDVAGVIEAGGQVEAAWVLDGVTGINGSHVLPAETDARWLVQRADVHLRQLAAQPLTLLALLAELVAGLKADFAAAIAGRTLPADYDVPAACLVLVKRFGESWQALRLGDSLLISSEKGVLRHHPLPPSDLGDLEAELRREALRLRQAGPVDFKALLARFKPRLATNRRQRNRPGSYGILVADESALTLPEVIELGQPSQVLLCTDGFYRAVETYGLHDDAGLMRCCAMAGGVGQVLAQVRAVELADPDCQTHLRFKPADDAAAIMLVR